MIHFNWLQLIVPHDMVHVATMALAMSLMIVLGVGARLALGHGEKAIVPMGRFSLKGVFECLTEFVAYLCDKIIGDKGRGFTPIFATLFFIILITNVLGLVPGMTPATENINTTFAFGLFSFVLYNLHGVKEHGLAYVKQFLGPLILLAPLMIVIELISHTVRPASLGLRLQGNMLGDHTVLGIFLDLLPYGVPIIFYMLGLFVCFIQAFVFTMLSMIYVSMAISHDH